MTTFWLMRHGHPDYSRLKSWGVPGWGSDLAPLSDEGVERVASQIGVIKENNERVRLAGVVPLELDR